MLPAFLLGISAVNTVFGESVSSNKYSFSDIFSPTEPEIMFCRKSTANVSISCVFCCALLSLSQPELKKQLTVIFFSLNFLRLKIYL